MNTVLDDLKTRRSVRKYKGDMIPKEQIERIIEADLHARRRTWCCSAQGWQGLLCGVALFVRSASYPPCKIDERRVEQRCEDEDDVA